MPISDRPAPTSSKTLPRTRSASWTYGVDDIPLVPSSKQYNNDGTLFSPVGETDSPWGDVIHVNDQPWPFFKFEPRKCRLRSLNAAVSRSFILCFRRQTGSADNIPRSG